MTRPFIACSEFGHLELLKLAQTVIFGFGKIFIMSADTFIEDLPKIHQPDHFNLF